MSLLDRRRLGFGLALLLCVALVAWWGLRPDHAVRAPTRVDTPVSDETAPATSPSAATITPSPQTSAPGEDAARNSGTFRGRAIDAVTREPVHEFKLELLGTRVRDAGAPAREETFRTSDGRFELRDLPYDNWSVVATAHGYQRFEGGVQITRGDPAPEVILPLRPGYTVNGRVYDEATHDGIASASIAFREAQVGRWEGDFRSRVRVTSDKNGAFVLDGVPGGRITLEVSANDYASRELDVVAGEDTAPVEIGLSIGGLIAGRLTAADGVTPVAGNAGLSFLDQEFGSMGRTGEDGEFSFPNLAPGRYRLTGQAEGATVTRDIVLAANESIDGIVLALGAGHGIRGVVTGLRPELLGRVRISLRRDADGGDFGDVGVDERGAYVLAGVQAGRVEVVADLNMQRQLTRTVEMPADSDLTVNLDFPAGARLSGRVTYGGQPLKGVDVMPRPLGDQSLFFYGTTTGGDGRYVLEDVPPGEYSVRFGDLRSRRVQISADSVLDVDIPAAQLSGRVLEVGGKVPIVEANVDLWTAAESDPSPLRLYGRSNDLGQFQLRGMEPGDFILTVYKPGYEMVRERISYGSPASDMTVQLRQDVSVELRVRDADGNPLQQVFTFEKIGDRQGSRFPVHLDENGVGHIPGAFAGSTLTFAAKGYAGVTVQDWNGQDLDVRMARN